MGRGRRQLAVAGIQFTLRASAAALGEPLREGLDDVLGDVLGSFIPSAEPEPADSEQAFFEMAPSGEATKFHADAAGMRIQVAADDPGPGLRGMLVTALDRRGSALLHGAGVVIAGGAVLCIAPSEGGKTTLCGKLAGRVPILSDETVALRLDGVQPLLAGTFFWSGPALPTSAELFPLRAVCFLRKGSVGLFPLPGAVALQELLLEWHLPERPGAAEAALARAAALLAHLPSFTLHTTLDADPLPLLTQAAEG